MPLSNLDSLTAATEAPVQGDSPPTAQQAEIEALFFALMRRVREHLEVRTQEFGITFQQALSLRHLEEDSPTPMRGLAESLHCDASYVTSIADGLEARGLVRRRPDPADRRVKQLVLTPEGRKLKDALERRILEDSPIFGGLSEEEQSKLRELLQKLAG